MMLRRLFIFLWIIVIPNIVCCSPSSADKKGLIADVPSPGAWNAIRRAYQMTDLEFTTLDSIYVNPTKAYKAGEKVKGVFYSSVKEKHAFVGMDVSFHTFMTAIHNPKSVIYKVDVSKPPYHGKNCGAYYGTVCSGLAYYALDMKIYQKAYDYITSDYFQLVEDQSSKGVRLADVLNTGGHVQLVTAIKRNPRNGKAEEIEICEAVRSGCRRVILSGSELDQMLTRKKRRKKLYRYKYLDSVRYNPLTEFVAVGNERLTPFKYNDDICTSRGDKACYIVGDSVILNIAKGYKELEIYKDSALYKTIDVGNNLDIVLRDLAYGNYKARLVKGKKRSDCTYWKVIDTKVSIDQKRNIVKFHSENATPVFVEFCTSTGGRPTKGVFDLSNENIKNGYVDVSSFSSKLKRSRYVKVHFKCDYGRVINKPIKWRIK